MRKLLALALVGCTITPVSLSPIPAQAAELIGGWGKDTMVAPDPVPAIQEIPWAITGTAGFTDNDFQTGAELLFPLYYRENTLFFLYPEVAFFDKNRQNYSLGLGVRHYFEEFDAILGLNAFWDISDSTYDNTYHGFGLGAELLTHRFDARFNWYNAEDDENIIDTRNTVDRSVDVDSSTSWGQPYGTDHRILQPGQTTTTTTTTSVARQYNRFESAMDGIDTEAGVLLPYIDKLADVRVFGGYYKYDNRYGSDLEGFKARAEVRLTENITFDVAYYDDKELFGGKWFGGVRLHFPIGKVHHPVHISGGYVDPAPAGGGKSIVHVAPGKSIVGYAKDPIVADGPVFSPVRARLTENIIRTPRIITTESDFIENVKARKIDVDVDRESRSFVSTVMDDVIFVEDHRGYGGHGRPEGPKRGREGPGPREEGELAAEAPEGEGAGAVLPGGPHGGGGSDNPYARGTYENPVHQLQKGVDLAGKKFDYSGRIWNVVAQGNFRGDIHVKSPTNIWGRVPAYGGHYFGDENARLRGGFRAANISHLGVRHFDISGGLRGGRRGGMGEIEMLLGDGGGGFDPSDLIPKGGRGIGVYATNVDNVYVEHNEIDTRLAGVVLEYGPRGRRGDHGGDLQEIRGPGGPDGPGRPGGRYREPNQFSVSYNDIYSPVGVALLADGRSRVYGKIKGNHIEPALDLERLPRLDDLAFGLGGPGGPAGLEIPGIGIGILAGDRSQVAIDIWGNQIDQALLGVGYAAWGRSNLNLRIAHNDVDALIAFGGLGFDNAHLGVDLLYNDVNGDFPLGEFIADLIGDGPLDLRGLGLPLDGLPLDGLDEQLAGIGGLGILGNLGDLGLGDPGIVPIGAADPGPSFIDLLRQVQIPGVGSGLLTFGNATANFNAVGNKIDPIVGFGFGAIGNSTINAALSNNWVQAFVPVAMVSIGNSSNIYANLWGNHLDARLVLPVIGVNLPGVNVFALAAANGTIDATLKNNKLTDGLVNIAAVGLNRSDIYLDAKHNKMQGLVNNLFLGFDDADLNVDLHGNWMDPEFDLGSLIGDTGIVPAILGSIDPGLPSLPGADLGEVISSIDVPGAAVLSLGFGNADINLYAAHNHIDPLVGFFAGAFGNSTTNFEAVGNHVVAAIPFAFLSLQDATINSRLYGNHAVARLDLNGLGESTSIPGLDLLAVSLGNSRQNHTWEGNTFKGAIGALGIAGGSSRLRIDAHKNWFKNELLGVGLVAFGDDRTGADLDQFAIVSNFSNNGIWAPGISLGGDKLPGIGYLQVAIEDDVFMFSTLDGDHIHAGALGAVNWSLDHGQALTVIENAQIKSDGYSLLPPELLDIIPPDLNPFPEGLGIAAGVWNQDFTGDDFFGAGVRVANSKIWVGQGDGVTPAAGIVNLASGDDSGALAEINGNSIKTRTGPGIYSEASGEDALAITNVRNNWITSAVDGIVSVSSGPRSTSGGDVTGNMIHAGDEGIRAIAVTSGPEPIAVLPDEDETVVAFSALRDNTIKAVDDGIDFDAFDYGPGLAIVRALDVTGNDVHAGDDGFDFESQNGGLIEVNPLGEEFFFDNRVKAGENLIETDPFTFDVSGDLTVNGRSFELPVTVGAP